MTTIMVFTIQHTQSREQAATQLKLDELIRALPGADDHLVHVEAGADTNSPSSNSVTSNTTDRSAPTSSRPRVGKAGLEPTAAASKSARPCTSRH